jgi:transposase-like protein
MKDPEFKQLMGIVEVDETYIGGKQENRHWKDRQKYRGGGSAHTGKTTVIGAISRKGNVVCIEDTSADTLSGFVEQTVSEKVSLVATDEWGGYRDLRYFYPHQVISHRTGEYVRGEVHTNNIESFWSLLKRGVIGTHHHISKKYLPLYLAEFQFRFNNRNNDDIFGEAIGGCCSTITGACFRASKSAPASRSNWSLHLPRVNHKTMDTPTTRIIIFIASIIAD